MVQVGNVDFNQAGNGNLTNTGYLDFVGSTGHGAITMINQGTITNTGTAALSLYGPSSTIRRAFLIYKRMPQ